MVEAVRTIAQSAGAWLCARTFPKREADDAAILESGSAMPKPVVFANWFLASCLVVSLGAGIVKLISPPFYDPRAQMELYAKVVIFSAVASFILGSLIYYQWRPEAAKWIWIAGVGYFAWRLRDGLAPSYVFDWDSEFKDWALLTLMSVGGIFYSAGAWFYAGVVAKPALAPNPDAPESS